MPYRATHSVNPRGRTLLLLLLFVVSIYIFFFVFLRACLASEIRKCANSRRRVTCGVELQRSYVPPTLTNLNALAMRGTATRQCKHTKVRSTGRIWLCVFFVIVFSPALEVALSHRLTVVTVIFNVRATNLHATNVLRLVDGCARVCMRSLLLILKTSSKMYC